MIYSRTLDSHFKTKGFLLDELKRNIDAVKLAKKSNLKKSDGVMFIPSKADIIGKDEEDGKLEYGDHVYPVINTTNYLDSHEDVHLNGIWNKSVKEQKGKVSLIINHDFKIGSVISFPDEVDPMVKVMGWKELGAEYDGETEALIFKSMLTEDSNKEAFKMYRNKRAVQHSVHMEYVKLFLAVDSENKDWKEEKKNWEKYFPLIVNPEKANKNGYFWAVKEAKIYKEGSMVLAGSNDITPTLYNLDAGSSTSKIESELSTQRIEAINKLLDLSKF